MAKKVDKLVDIYNGKSKEKGKYTAYFTPKDGHKIQIKLLHILAWFTKWNDTVKRLGNNKDNFLSVQSWNSLQSLILGLVGLIEVEVKRNDQTIVPKTTNIDGIEKHFSCSRQNIGRGNAPTAQMQQTNDTRASAYIASSEPKKGNNAKTPALFEKKKIYKLSYNYIIIII